MTTKLSAKSRPEPDVLAAHVAYEPDRICFLPDEVDLVGEVVSEESQERDRETEPFKYAREGVRHFWRTEEEHLGRRLPGKAVYGSPMAPNCRSSGSRSALVR
ncbi:hypothetical protein GCM10010271_17290 [Streptomyces kurssanovii]|nr:hypothetical protein GCM10010271_17290 [Streptomyces kurssanovii]